MSKKIDELVRLLAKGTKSAVKPQMVWAKVSALDWENKKMTAIGLVDELEYFEVLLGLGHVFKKPRVGSLCLLGIIANHDAFTFLIEAEDVEEMQLQSNTTNLTIGDTGYKVSRGNENLKEVLNDFIDEVLKIVVLQGRSINVPVVTQIKARLNTILT
jgi:hypothetical protein